MSNPSIPMTIPSQLKKGSLNSNLAMKYKNKTNKNININDPIINKAIEINMTK